MFRNEREQIATLYKRWVRSLARLIASAKLQTSQWRILALLNNGRFDIYLKKNRKLMHLGTLEGDATPDHAVSLRKKLRKHGATKQTATILGLSDDSVIRKQILLPKGADDIIEPILQNQMARIAPWPEEQTCFNYTLNEARAGSDQLEVTVTAASQESINDHVETLAHLDIIPDKVEYRDKPDIKPGLPLQTLGNDPTDKYATNITRTLALFFVLSLSICAFGLYQLNTAFNKNRELTERLNTTQKIVSALSKANTDSLKVHNQRTELLSRKKNETPVLLLLEELSKTIPDSAWLTKLEIKRNAVIITGQAGDAANLIKTLESSKYLEKVRFAAPTTRSSRTRIDTFSIIATPAPGVNFIKGKSAQ